MEPVVVTLVAAIGVILVQVLGLVLSHVRAERQLRSTRRVGSRVRQVQGKQDEVAVSIDHTAHLVNSHMTLLDARIQQLEQHIRGLGAAVPLAPKPGDAPPTSSA